MPTITLLSRGNRSGTFTTPSYTVPASASGYYLLRTNVLASHLSGLGRSATVLIERSPDGGATWLPVGGFTWVSGGGAVKGTGNPGFGGWLDELAGQLVRATLTLSGSTSLGFVVEMP